MFGHDEEHALLTVVDLVNTARETSGEERLDVGSLASLLRDRDVRDVGAVTESDVIEIRELRQRLLVIFSAESPASAAAEVNAIVRSARATPRLSDHDGRHWHVHYFAPDATLAEHLAADCGMALARVIADDELERLRRCDADDCSHVLVDLSRNRSKRYCDSRRCGNRVHVAAYRERRRASDAVREDAATTGA